MSTFLHEKFPNFEGLDPLWYLLTPIFFSIFHLRYTRTGNCTRWTGFAKVDYLLFFVFKMWKFCFRGQNLLLLISKLLSSSLSFVDCYWLFWLSIYRISIWRAHPMGRDVLPIIGEDSMQDSHFLFLYIGHRNKGS